MLMMTQMIEQRLRFSFTIHLFNDDGIVVYCNNFFAQNDDTHPVTKGDGYIPT